MALVPCRECGKDVSDSAPKCPHCGVVTPSLARNQRDNKFILGCVGGIFLIPILFLGWCFSAIPDVPAPGTPSYQRAEASANNVTPERFAAVQEVLEAQPGVRVERDPAAPATMRIHVARLDVTPQQARQIATMARERLGENAIVYVYDRAGVRLVRVTAYSTEQ